MTERRRSSSTMPGLRPCPHCNGGERATCAYCEGAHFVTVDRTGAPYLQWLKHELATKDTDPEMPAVAGEEPRK